jgi:hypothetical protein
MSIATGPKNIVDGLVFSYDISNTQKSWKGAPTTNLHPIGGYITWPTQSLHFWNGNKWIVDGTYTDPGLPGPVGTYLGQVRKYTSGALSASWSGNSYAYILKTAPMTAGQSYAMSAYTFLSSDCNIDGMNSSIEGASVSALSGGYPTTYNMSQKGTWQRQGLQGTGSGNVNFIVAYPYKIGVTNGVFTGSILVGGAQVEFGTFPTPYTDTSRSNTQAVFDVTNTRVITANSLNYLNNNTFEFDGANGNQLTFPYTQTQPNNFSVIAWIYQRSYSTDTNIGDVIVMPYSNYNAWIFSVVGTGSKLEIRHHNFSSSTTSYNVIYNTNLNLNTWYHVGATDDGNNVRLYVNGINVVTLASAVSTTNGTMSCQIGAWGGAGTGTYFDGKIPVVQIYNRALSAAEVQQNFIALRGRFGI